MDFNAGVTVGDSSWMFSRGAAFLSLVWRGEEDKQYLLETAPFLGWKWPFSIWSLSCERL